MRLTYLNSYYFAKNIIFLLQNGGNELLKIEINSEKETCSFTFVLFFHDLHENHKNVKTLTTVGNNVQK